MAIYDPTTPDEVWYPIPSLPGYQISSDFRIRTCVLRGRAKGGAYATLTDRWRAVKVYPLKIGYLVFDAKRRPVYLHRVIAELLYGEQPPGVLVRHYDDDKLNNHAGNLRLGTRADNAADAVRNGRHALGAGTGRAKLDEAKVRSIRDEIRQGKESMRAISRKYGITLATLLSLRDRKTWRQVV